MIWKQEEIWKVEWDDRARKELRKLDQSIQREILNYLRARIEGSKNPRLFGKGLSGNKEGLWRYRVGNYRLVCRIEDHTLVFLVVGIGHKKEIYDS